ncbi:MAG: valine--tRNA ligase [Candidatus Aenigmarchaeota archaeon]|nr:valine--tRNA ligase [Candidatus Aenigmarchaeota archaeon]
MDKSYKENPELIKKWEKLEVSNFKNKGEKYVIDSPPPYPSGELHLGNTLNWTWMDAIARFQRMSGKDVFFAQGWDVHGMPTEVKVEMAFGKKAHEVERTLWRKMCRDWSEKNISGMKEMIIKLGSSIDWSSEFRTSDPNYIKHVQKSFLDLQKKGYIYQAKHPVNFCTTCSTAISDAEVEYAERATKISYIIFEAEGGEKVEIATTRPELMASCVAVAVNPEDRPELVGKKIKVPIFGRQVKIIASKEVDPKFGTGVVMICAFGDKQDVEWILSNNLPIIESIDEEGKMVVEPYKGLTTAEAKEKILADLKEKGLVTKIEPLQQKVGTCWRCHKPIEILSREQWFVAATKFKDKVIEETKKVNWIPDYMQHRQIDWTNNMNWDWCISRKKVYGTPIPVWYCPRCGELYLPKAEELPVDPATDTREIKCKCGSLMRGETNTLDTWMDSSVTIAYICSLKGEFDKMYPADLQPNGSDIIRTWDYYLMLRHLMWLGKRPYENCLINGMVLGADGKKMSKSLGNYVTAKELLEKYPVDAVRYWTYLATPGSNIIYSEDQIKRGEYLLIKLWNSARFCSQMMEKTENPKLMPVDLWILSRLKETNERVKKHLEDYEISKAMLETEQFFVSEFCDYYLEFIKYRIYQDMDAAGAKSTLYTVLLSVIEMLAPFFPYITDSIYSELFSEKEEEDSIHQRRFPSIEVFDEESLKTGEALKKAISEVRKWKISKQVSLGKEVEMVEVSLPKEDLERIKKIETDVKMISRAKSVKLCEGELSAQGHL